jgi:CubicO group peptidase (beta-lactamase class C family)
MISASRQALAVLGASACIASQAVAQNLATKIDAYLKERPAGPFSGVILVARDGSPIFERAYGLADADLDVRNTVQTRFGIASLTKPITATAVMRLVEQGRLKLSESICSYVAQCPGAWRAVTLEHLLTHTSGIPDLFGDMPAAPVDSTRAVMDGVIAKHLGDTLLSPPGARYAYTNFNYCLLGYAVEIATGEPWEAVLRREVIGPVGMRDTQYDDVWAIMPRRARGYTREGGALRHIRYRDHAAYAAGGLLSSARDLLRFDVALSRGRLVADSTLRNMETPRLGEYGLGWQIITVFGQRLRNHTGGTNGYTGHISHYDDGTTIIVLSNVETEQAKATACDVAALVFGSAPSPPGGGRVPCRRTL